MSLKKSEARYMNTSLERSWKKVYASDVEYVAIECRDHLPHHSVLIIEGALGAGKTTFVKEFAKDINSSSPSYSVINEYADVVHADFYRIKESSEIIHLELGLYLESRPYLLIEWGLNHIQRVANEVPEDFSFFLLEVEINDPKEGNIESRNYFLKSICEL